MLELFMASTERPLTMHAPSDKPTLIEGECQHQQGLNDAEMVLLCGMPTVRGQLSPPQSPAKSHYSSHTLLVLFPDHFVHHFITVKVNSGGGRSSNLGGGGGGG